MIIRNYEVRTGHVVSMVKLESGYLKSRLRPEDYDIKQWVGDSSTIFTTKISTRIAPEGPL